jgi:hypothetical protein
MFWTKSIQRKQEDLERYLGKLKTNGVQDITLLFRGTAPKDNLYRIRHWMYEKNESARYEISAQDVNVKKVKITESPAVLASVDTYLSEIRQLRGQGFSVTPEVQTLAKHGHIAMRMVYETNELAEKVQDALKSLR